MHWLKLTLLTVLAWTNTGLAADLPQSIGELADGTWLVTGTVTDSKSGHEIAFIEQIGIGRSATLRMGEMLGDGYALDRVSPHIVVFRKGSDRRSIEISRGIGKTEPKPPSVVEGQTQTSLPEKVSNSGQLRISVSRKRVEELLINHHEIANQVRLESVTGPDGEKSLRINANPGTRLLEEFGLSNGDILLAAKGERVTQTQELSAIVLNAEPGEAIPIAVQRAGEIRQITYQISE